MDKPLTCWYCDICGGETDAVDGYVIWGDDEKMRPMEFTIIDRGNCDNKRKHNSLPLSRFLGVEGLNTLLGMLSVGPIKNRLGEGSSPINEIDGFVDFFRRVQTPYYEEARRYFDNMLDDFDDANECYPYQERMLKLIIERHDV